MLSKHWIFIALIASTPPTGGRTTIKFRTLLSIYNLTINFPFSIDSLYIKIFPAIGGNKGSVDPASVEQIGQFAKKDEPFVRLLCQWAVSDQRCGEHRAIAAALLLEKRQMDLVALTENDAAGVEDNDTDENLASASAFQPVYQVFLFSITFLGVSMSNVDFLGIFNEIS